MKSLGLFLMLATPCLFGQPSLAVTGVVRQDLTGHPLPNILVSLNRTDAPGPEQAVTTVSNGQFEFLVPPGTYRLMAESPIFGGQIYGATSFQSGSGVALVLTPGTSLPLLDFRLTPPAAIEGTITDGHGEPIQAAQVQLFQTSILEGRRSVIARGSASTNDLGNYRFPGLGPGEYHLIASGTPWHTWDGLAPGRGSYLVPQFYPNARSADSAAPLVLRVAEEARADFRLDEATGPGVQISLVEAPPGIVLRLSIYARGVGGRNRLQHLGTVSSSVHRVDGIPPGEYEVVLQGVARGKQYRGSARFSLGSEDGTVRMPVHEMPTISGRVDCAGQSTSKMTLSFYDPDQAARVPVALRPDGTFTSAHITPGRYSFLFAGAANCAVDRITAGGKALPGNRLVVGTDPIAEVVVEAKSVVSSVHGILRRGEAAQPGVKVYLAPVPPNESGPYRVYLTDGDGSFDFRRLPAGRYALFLAPGALELFEYANPEAVAPYLKAAPTIDLEANQRIRHDITQPDPQ